MDHFCSSVEALAERKNVQAIVVVTPAKTTTTKTTPQIRRDLQVTPYQVILCYEILVSKVVVSCHKINARLASA